MIRYLYVLGLALAAMTGCATVGEGPGGRNITMTSLFPSDARAYAQTAAFADSSRALAASGTGGFASHCEAGGTCTQVSVLPRWAAGGYVGPYAGASQWSAGQAFADAVESAPPLRGGVPNGGSDPGLAGTVDALGKRVEGIETAVGEIKEDVRVIATMHAPDPAPIQTK